MEPQIRDFNPALEEAVDVIREGQVVDRVVTIKGIEVIFNNIVYAALGFVGLALLIMLFMGGFQMLTAGGEAPKVEQARKTLTYAIAGLVLIALSFFIIRLISDFTGLDVTQFRATQP